MGEGGEVWCGAMFCPRAAGKRAASSPSCRGSHVVWPTFLFRMPDRRQPPLTALGLAWEVLICVQKAGLLPKVTAERILVLAESDAHVLLAPQHPSAFKQPGICCPHAPPHDALPRAVTCTSREVAGSWGFGRKLPVPVASCTLAWM